MEDLDLKKMVFETLGQEINYDFDDYNDPTIQKLNTLYENTIKRCLMSYRWNFAKKKERLDEIEPIEEYEKKI
jgi:hypothetical protein